MTPVEVIIDYKKLQMFGQICCLKDGYIAKEIFNHRIVRYVKGDSQTVGFVPDIYRLLQKHGIIELFPIFAMRRVPVKIFMETDIKKYCYYAIKAKRFYRTDMCLLVAKWLYHRH